MTDKELAEIESLWIQSNTASGDSMHLLEMLHGHVPDMLKEIRNLRAEVERLNEYSDIEYSDIEY